MNYTVNPLQFSSVFVLPASITDEHLKLCSAAQLKTVLAVYRCQNTAFNEQTLCALTGLPECEVADALQFWAQRGVLLVGGEVPSVQAPVVPTPPVAVAAQEPKPAVQPAVSEPEAPAKSARKSDIDLTPSKPTHEQISKRLNESAELRELFSEVQTALGRLLGTGDQAALLLLFDYYGLKTEVLLMLCEYARSIGKASNLNYIYTVGADWSSREIDTLERADEEITRLRSVNASWTQLCALTGMKHPTPTKNQQKYLSCWLEDWHFSLPMIALAYEKMQEHKEGVDFRYLNGILKNWNTKGIRTPEQIEQEERDFREKASPKEEKTAPKRPNANTRNGIPDTPASYDLNEAEQQARQSVPVLRKRKR